jgi:hypothetical protein
VIGSQPCQWLQELQDDDDPAVRELGEVILASVGAWPLLGRPVIWQWRPQAGAVRPRWCAVAVTDRLQVNITLTVTEIGTVTTYTSAVRILEHAAAPPTAQ